MQRWPTVGDVVLSIREMLERVVPLLGADDGPGGADLETVAAAVGLSPCQAQRTVTAVLGESPDRHQRRLRLERAAVELMLTDRRILDIALDAGYASHEAFTRAFARHLGRTPRAYRALRATRAYPGSDAEPEVAASAVATVGPCIRLYRVAQLDARIDMTRGEPMDPTIDEITVERRTLTETPTLHQVRRVDATAIAAALTEMLPAVYQHIMASGAGLAGPPYARYLAASPAFLTIEAGMPLTSPQPAAPEAGVEAGVLPGGKAAVVVHTGPYDDLPATHAALDRWLAANGEEAAGPAWESYVTDPGETPDPADWRTEVIWPLTDG